MVKVTIEVKGMMCGMCESHVNDAVRKAVNVKKVTSSHAKNETVIIAEDNIDCDAAVAAIKAQGYEVGNVSSEPYEKHGLFGRKK